MKLGGKLGAWIRPRPAVAQAEAAEPCIPCGQQRGVRQFSLNPAPPLVLEDDLRVELTPSQLFAVVDGELVLYDPVRARSHVLNSSAAAVWASIEGPTSVVEVIDRVQVDTGADRAVLDADVRATLAQFAQAEILRGAAGEPDAATHPPAGPVGYQPVGADRWAPTVARLLDRVDWPTRIGPVRLGDAEVIVRTDDPIRGPQLQGTLAELAAREGSSGTGATVISVRAPGRGRRARWYVDGRRQWTGPGPAAPVDDLLADLTQRLLSSTPDKLLMHAGAVERSGRVVLVGGDSGRGKSTLTAALTQRGFAYATDEVAVVDPEDLAVTPYPKALDLDDGSLALLGLEAHDTGEASGLPADPKGRRAVPVSRLGAASAGGHLALIVLLDDEVRDGPDASPSPAIRAVLDLIGVTFRESFADECALEWLAGLAAHVATVRVIRGPLDHMVDQVESALAAVPASAGARAPAPA